MLYKITFFDSNKEDTIESMNYQIKDGFVDFYYDIVGLGKTNVASYRSDNVSYIKMVDTTILKSEERLKKLKSLDISKWQKFKNSFKF